MQLIHQRRPKQSPGEPLRVAILSACLGFRGGIMGGAEKQAFYMLRSLAESGVDVRLFTLSADAYGPYEDDLRRMQIPSLSFGGLPGLPIRLLRLLVALRGFRPHIIQSVHAYLNVYSAMTGRILGAVSVGGLRSELSASLVDNGRFSRFLLTWPDALAVNSRSSIDEVRRSNLLDASRVHFLPNVIDIAGFPERPAVPEHGSVQRFTCMCIGRLFPAKRLDVFLRAIAAARRSVPGLRGVIAGFGPEEPALQRLAAHLDLLPDTVVFLGPQEDVRALLRKADVFVFCSESEGTPNVILEAMAAGLPVVTTPAGDTGDLIDRAGAGYVVPFGDVPAIVNAIAQLAASPELCRALGEAARSHIARHRGTSELAGILTEIYSKVVRRSVRPYRRDVLACFGQCADRI